MTDAHDAIEAICRSLGLVVGDCLGEGDEGVVWAIGDGLAVKLTSSAAEAAACLAILDHQARNPHGEPGVFRISSVHRVEGVEVGAFERGVDEPSWVVVRDVMDTGPMENDREAWEEVLNTWSFWMNRADVPGQEDSLELEGVLELADEHGIGEGFRSLIATIKTLQSIGIEVRDYSDSMNFGCDRDGAYGPLDLGHAGASDALLDRAFNDPSLVLEWRAATPASGF